MEGRNSSRARDAFLALAVLTGEMTGPVLCAVTVLRSGGLLSGWLENLYFLLGGVLAVGFMTVCFCLGGASQEKGFSKIKKYWMDVLRLELWLTAVLYLWKLLAKIWEQAGRRFLQNDLLYVGILAVSILGALFAAGLLLCCLMRLCGHRGAGKNYLRVLMAFGMLIGAAAVLTAVSWGWNWLLGMLEPSVTGMLAYHVLMAYCEYWILRLLLLVMEKGNTIEDTKVDIKVDIKGAVAENTIETEKEGTSENKIEAEKEGTSENTIEVKKEGIAENTIEVEKEITVEPTIEQAREEATKENTPENALTGTGQETPIEPRSKAMGLVIPLVVTLVLALVPNILSPSLSILEQVEEALDAPLSMGYGELAEGNLEQAVLLFDRTEARIQAFESLTDADAEVALKTVHSQNPDDFVIGTLYFSAGGLQQELENGIISNTLGSEWYPVLLRYYEEQESLAGEQEGLRKELLLWCVSREQYTKTDCIFAADLEENKLAVRKLLGEYREALDGYSFFDFLVRYNKEGGCTKELAYEALTKAEEEPEDMLLQYMACLIGSGYQEDGAVHYTRTVEVAGRFDQLYDDGSRTDGQIAAEKRFLGEVAEKCYDFETALAYYEETFALSGESGVALDCAKICERLKNYEGCAEMAEQVLKEDAGNTQALYLLTISALKTGDVDAALDAAGRLGDLVANKSGAVDMTEENNLYVCAQYLAMSDSSRWTDYTWRIYDSLSEEQIEAARSHELLWYYMTAINQCFMKEDYEAAAEAVDKVLELNKDLAMAWYLRGTIAFSAKEFKKAVSSFQKSEELGYASPALYFSMANAYDALEDYENALFYSRRVEELLPYQDHGNDVYGISVHNKRLLSALESKTGR